MVVIPDVNQVDYDKPSQLEIKDEKQRLVEAYATVEVVDKDGEIIPIEEFKKIMPIIMDRGGLVMYEHSNKPVGKILNWEITEHEKTKKPAVKLLIKVFDHYDFDNKVWNMIKEGRIKGISFGGISSEEVKSKDGAKVLKDIMGYEFSVVENPANPYATIKKINYFAKKAKDKGIIEDWQNINYNRDVIYILPNVPMMSVLALVEDLNERGFDASLGRTDNSIVIEVKPGHKELVMMLIEEEYPEIGAYIIEKDVKKYQTEYRGYFIVWNIMPDGSIQWYAYNMDSNTEIHQDKTNIPKEEIISYIKKIINDYEEKGVLPEDVVLTKHNKKSREVRKPFLAWKDFNDCVSHMKEQYSKKYSGEKLEEVARKVCGRLYWDYERGRKKSEDEEEAKRLLLFAKPQSRETARELLDAYGIEESETIDRLIDWYFDKKDSEIMKVDDRYLTEDGRFKIMTCPDDPDEKSRFCGCVRAMMNEGKSLESAKRICGYIRWHVKKGENMDTIKQMVRVTDKNGRQIEAGDKVRTEEGIVGTVYGIGENNTVYVKIGDNIEEINGREVEVMKGKETKKIFGQTDEGEFEYRGFYVNWRLLPSGLVKWSAYDDEGNYLADKEGGYLGENKEDIEDNLKYMIDQFLKDPERFAKMRRRLVIERVEKSKNIEKMNKERIIRALKGALKDLDYVHGYLDDKDEARPFEGRVKDVMATLAIIINELQKEKNKSNVGYDDELDEEDEYTIKLRDNEEEYEIKIRELKDQVKKLKNKVKTYKETKKHIEVIKKLKEELDLVKLKLDKYGKVMKECKGKKRKR